MKKFLVGVVLGAAISLLFDYAMEFSCFDAPKLPAAALQCQPTTEKVHTLTNTTLGTNPITDNVSCVYGPNGPRILCVIITYPDNYATKAAAVLNTWGKRCDKTVLIDGSLSWDEEKEKQRNASRFDKMSNTAVHLNVSNSYSSLTDKTIGALLYASAHFAGQFDWLLKADDDTYVIIENLRAFLATRCQQQWASYGFAYEPRPPEPFAFEFNSGGAGYVLSSSAVDLFSQRYAHDKQFCKNTTGVEDAELALCLRQIGVTPKDTRDQAGRQRFHPLSLARMWSIESSEWTFIHSKYMLNKGPDAVSDSSISFHYVSDQEMYQMDFLIYHLKRESSLKRL